MTWADEYRTKQAFWVALRTRATRHARTTQPPHPSHELLRQFVIQRFMARVFNANEPPWVVAGGIGMLIRVPGARATRDLDLTSTEPGRSDRHQVLDDIATHTGLSDLDPFDYTVDTAEPFTGVMNGTKLRITATIGADRAAVFAVDVAADTIPISDIERRQPNPIVPDVKGMSPLPAVPLYPLASQLADKIIGVMYRDTTGRSSNRYRDLVDLTLYAGAVDINGDDLRTALDRRAQTRNQPPPTTIDIPADWSTGYTRIATTTSLPEPLRHLDSAADTVSAWLNPLLSGELDTGYTWDHHAGAWRPPDRGPTVPGQVWVRPHTRDGRPITDHYRRRPQR